MKTYKIRQFFDELPVTLKDVMPDWDGDLNWEGYLNLPYAPITELPDNFTVGRWLNLSNTQIIYLPDNLKVGGFLDLSNTPITKLPDDLKVRGSIVVKKGQLTHIPKRLREKVVER